MKVNINLYIFSMIRKVSGRRMTMLVIREGVPVLSVKTEMEDYIHFKEDEYLKLINRLHAHPMSAKAISLREEISKLKKNWKVG